MTTTVASPAGAARAAAPEVLLDDAQLRVELHRAAQPASVLVVTFDPIAWPLDGRAYGTDFLTRAGADVIAWRKKQEHFFQGLTRERFDAVLAPHLARYTRRLGYGSSLGAYAVLYYCRQGFDLVVASSPRVSAHPRWGTPHWQQRVRFEHAEHSALPGGSPAVIFYDPHDPQDRPYVDQALRPAFPQAEFVAVPYAGHPANQFLGEIGFIAPYMRAVIADQPRPALNRRRAKARSAMYHQVLAGACLAHGHASWALALAQRALKISPQLLLSYRTLGEVELALGRLDDAEAHLRRFAERNPLDGTTQHALQQVARARAQQRGTPLAEPPAQPAWRRAASQWLRPLLRDADGKPTVLRRSLAEARRRFAGGGAAVTRDDVQWAYRQFLGRDPESEAVVAHHLLQPSQRALVQSLLDSHEYRHRQEEGEQATVGTARAGAHRGGGPRVLVVSNCQAPGLAAALAASCAVTSATPVVAGGISDQALARLLDGLAPEADLWFSSPGNRVAREHFKRHARPGARIVTVPLLLFNAFQPDVCYARRRGTQELTTWPYNSAIAAWGYIQGLTVEDTARLFNAATYRALGYLDAWGPAVDALRGAFAASDLKPRFDAFMQRVQREGCFMHTSNHPQIGPVALLARLAAAEAGVKCFDEPAPGELADGLNGTIWPVYPEIARALGLGPGSLTWKYPVRNRRIDGVRDFVEHSFAAYAEQRIAPADLELRFVNTERLDRTLRQLTGRPPR